MVVPSYPRHHHPLELVQDVEAQVVVEGQVAVVGGGRVAGLVAGDDNALPSCGRPPQDPPQPLQLGGAELPVVGHKPPLQPLHALEPVAAVDDVVRVVFFKHANRFGSVFGAGGLHDADLVTIHHHHPPALRGGEVVVRAGLVLGEEETLHPLGSAEVVHLVVAYAPVPLLAHARLLRAHQVRHSRAGRIQRSAAPIDGVPKLQHEI
mmetsp:Transcript_35012/g.58875  ORF Transcript_35012/g.58875 Transcript_35012/m.58875 type:complete len:207 (-) Transcript_35012:525-1145(-)